MNKSRVRAVEEAVSRFPQYGNRTLARYLIDTQGILFDNDLEKARTTVRYVRGANGYRARGRAGSSGVLQFREDVNMPETWRKVRAEYHLGAGLWLFIADLHVPFHEPKAIEAAVGYAKKHKVNGVFINGDFMDDAALGFWGTARRDWNKEVEAGIDMLDWLRKEFGNRVKFVYKPGNHEYRLPRYFISNAPELALSPLAAMETVMDFEWRGIDFLDYYQLVFAGELPVLHGHEVRNITRSVNPARGLFLRTKTFSMCAHCHSTSDHCPRSLTGKLLTTWSMGCLCHLSPDFSPYGNDWNWGFALVHVEKNGRFEVENRRIMEGSGRVV